MTSIGETVDNTKPKVQFETKRVLVTPKLAKETLDFHNDGNRRLNPMRVKMFARLMKEGKWMLIHQGIALAADGTLIDGQHRLAAVIESGCSIWMMVSKGVPLETKLVVDSVTPRTIPQRLTLIGREETATHIAVAKILEYGPIGSSQTSRPIEEVICLLDKYKEILDFACDFRSFKGMSSTTRAVFGRASFFEDKAKIRRFVEVLRTEVPETKNESTALKLKKMVLDKTAIHDIIYGSRHSIHSGRVGGSGEGRQYIYNLTESALYRYLKNDPVKTLLPATKELFQLPPHLQPEKKNRK